MKTYKVFTYNMMVYLSHKGFRFIDVIPNIKNPNKNVFCYEYTDELLSAVNEYINNNKKADM